MFEVILSLKKSVNQPWMLFFAGLLYSSFSFLLVKFIFSRDVVLSRYSGLLVVMFSVLFCIIFVYSSMKLDEKENLLDKTDKKAFFHDWRILSMFVWLFLGFVIGFCLWQIAFPNSFDFNAQIETYCVLNNPLSYSDCLNSYSLNQTMQGIESIPKGNFLGIFTNNMTVALFILLFSLIFGAGSIFIIIWNASIISSVIVLSIKSQVTRLPISLSRFLIHGIPEIASYFLFAMAGGMTSFALVSFFKGKLPKENMLIVVRRASYLAVIGIILLMLSAIVEVFLINRFF